MISYLTILAASLCGYASMPIWTIGAATVALMSLAYAENADLYRRGGQLGLLRHVDAALLNSLVTAVCATGAAYGFGIFVRFLSAA